MKIKQAELFKIRLPVLAPFRTGFGVVTERILVWVKLTDENGLVGYGESANLELPFYEPEYNDSMMLLLKKYLIPKIIDKNINTIQDLEGVFSVIKANNFAKTVVEAAFWHLEMQKRNEPLRKLWGGSKTKIPVGISIGLGKDLNTSIKKILDYIDKFNPNRTKIKIKPGVDIKLIEAIREKHPKLRLTVDANASYTLKNINIFKELDRFDLTMIEQPLNYDDFVDHSILQKQIKTPICLDESIGSYHDAEQAVKLGACKIMNIKPPRVGGYWISKKISEFCEKNNIPVWCGGMLESGWGQLFNSSIATLSNFTFENDICLTKWYLKDDILEEPIVETNGFVDIEATDRLFKIDHKKLKKYTIEKIIVE